MMSNAGIFEINVWKPYPCWCELKINGTTVGKFSHEELRDLHYTTERAMQKARNLLPDMYKNEV